MFSTLFIIFVGLAVLIWVVKMTLSFVIVVGVLRSLVLAGVGVATVAVIMGAPL